jgi:hypothetical protein
MEAWLADDHGRLYRARRWMKGYYYSRLPRDFRLVGLLHWSGKTAIASSGPAVAFVYGSIALGLAAATAAAIFVAHALVGLLDRMSREKASGTSEAQTEMMVRLGDLLAGTKANAVAPSDRDDAIRACLGILENFIRLSTKSKKGEISVNLILYTGNSTTRMKVRHRNAGNDRPVNREFDASHLAGHYACQFGIQPQVIHDLREFPKGASVSPTQTVVSYRSIFIMPVTSSGNRNHVARGFVSIDSTRPYAFYGNRASTIVVACEPVFSRICDLI